MFEKFLKRSSWTDIIISMIFIVFGVLMIAKPEATVDAISIVIGMVFISMGVLKVVEYFTSEEKADYLLTIAIVAVIFGVIMLFASDTIMSIARIILGVWVIAAGIMDFQTTLIWKEVKSPYWTIVLVFALLMMVSGIVIIATQNAVITVVGISIIVYGVLDIIDRIIFMKKFDRFKEEINK